MRRMKKFVASGLAALMVMGMLAGCGGNANTEGGENKEAKGSVYYLNFKPEQAEQWEELAKQYEDETGVSTVKE